MEIIKLILYFAPRKLNHYTNTIMKRATIILLALAVIALASKNHQQRELLNNINQQTTVTSEQVTDLLQAYEDLLDMIEYEDENFVLDVVTETDSYATYMELANLNNR